MSYHFYVHGGWPDPNLRLLNVERIGVLRRLEAAGSVPTVLYYETSSGLSFVQYGLFDTLQSILVNEDTVGRVLEDSTMVTRWLRALPRLELRRKYLLNVALDKGLGPVSRSAFRGECNRLYWAAATELDPVQFNSPGDHLFGAQA